MSGRYSTKCLGENCRKLLNKKNVNFIREGTEAAVSRFSAVNSHENTCGGVQLYIKVTELNLVVLM